MQYPESKPAYTALKIDRIGNLWARLWANDDEAAAWDVFDPDGDYLCAIDVPPDLDVIEIWKDQLLARYTLVLGVEEAREYRPMRVGRATYLSGWPGRGDAAPQTPPLLPSGL